MAISNLHLNTFKDLFTGNDQNYGQHVYKFSEKGEKEKGENRTVKNQLVTMANYKAHLEGKTGLGIIPINTDNKCKFVVIDVDVYNRDLQPYVAAIERYNLPMVPFYSKSGGLHIFIFFKQFIKVKDATKQALRAARLLSLTLLVKQVKNENVEIFPKQMKLDPNSVGNWINLPYFNAKDTKQKIFRANGETMGLDDALKYIQTKITTLTELKEALDELPYGDAPPCIQTLMILRMLNMDSGRNNFLFSCGVYLKKKDENYFEAELHVINDSLKHPLPKEEIDKTIIASLRKKDYTYKCTASPCLEFCDKKVCQSKEYGVGKDGGYFSDLIFGVLKQYAAAAPYYEWEVKVREEEPFKCLRFKNEDEIIKQDVFLKLCFRELKFLPFRMKQTEWFKLVNQALAEIQVEYISKEDDTSPVVRFEHHVFEFLTGRAMAENLHQINFKRVYPDPDHKEYLFKTKDLVDYLYDIKNFRLFTTGEIHGLLRDLGARKKVQRDVTGKQMRLTALSFEDVPDDYRLRDSRTFEATFKDYASGEDF